MACVRNAGARKSRPGWPGEPRSGSPNRSRGFARRAVPAGLCAALVAALAAGPARSLAAAPSEGLDPPQAGLAKPRVKSLRLAVEDLSKTFPDTYQGGAQYLQAIQAFEAELPALEQALARIFHT